jgi:hypothetical protein
MILLQAPLPGLWSGLHMPIRRGGGTEMRCVCLVWFRCGRAARRNAVSWLGVGLMVAGHLFRLGV